MYFFIKLRKIQKKNPEVERKGIRKMFALK